MVKNMYDNAKVIILFSKIWGLVPYADGNKYKRIALFMYSSCSTIFYVYVCFSFNIYSFKKIDEVITSTKLLTKILYVKISLQCILMLAVLIINMIKSKKFLHMLEKLDNLDLMLKKKFNVKISQRNNYIFQILYGVFIIFFVVYHCVELYLNENDLNLSIQWALLCNIHLIILFQCTIIIYELNARFKIFNNFLLNMNMFSKLNVSKMKTYFNYGQVDNTHRYRSLNILNQQRLKELHIIYLLIRDLLYEVNSYYSFQLLLIVCETFAVMITSISSFTFNITLDNLFSQAREKNLTLIHCGLRLLTIAILIHIAEQTSSEANSTVNIIHDFVKTEENENVKKGLELFLLDLWHHRVKFDAHGFFSLDYDLIQSILSAATTYVIVLIQFQLATTAKVNSNTPSS